MVAVENYGAGDLLEIERPPANDRPGQRFLVPMREEAVPQWDGERLVIASDFVEQP